MSGKDPSALEDGDRDLLLGALPATRLPAGRAQALWQRVAERTAMAPDRPFDIVRASEGEWRQALPGLRIKPLRVDAATRTQTSLWRLDAGACVPAHSHDAEEECLILEGSLQWGDRVYGPGDYLVAHPGGAHEEFTSPGGALFLIRSELTEPLQRLFA
jgi:anti-sigma factor ChrR (cupin superfamily)